jgi:hypothetical protein
MPKDNYGNSYTVTRHGTNSQGEHLSQQRVSRNDTNDVQVTTTAAVISVHPVAAREAPTVTTTPMPMEVITTPTLTVCLLSSPRLPFDPSRPVLKHATFEHGGL